MSLTARRASSRPGAARSASTACRRAGAGPARRDRGGGPRASGFAQQWAHAPRRAPGREPAPIRAAGPSNFNRAHVPWGVDLAAAWAWRFLVIVAAGYVVALG